MNHGWTIEFVGGPLDGEVRAMQECPWNMEIPAADLPHRVGGTPPVLQMDTLVYRRRGNRVIGGRILYDFLRRK